MTNEEAYNIIISEKQTNKAHWLPCYEKALKFQEEKFYEAKKIIQASCKELLIATLKIKHNA
jgi:hypothetical protein